MNRNPLEAALASYGAIKGIRRAEREDDLREREYARREEQYQDKKKLSRLAVAKSLIQSGDPEWYKHAPQDVVQEVMASVGNDQRYAYLRDPRERQRMMGAIQTIKQGFGGALPFESNAMLDAVNTVLRPQLMKGVANDGQPAVDKRIVGIYPADEGMENFYLDLEVTRASDGQRYRAPLTENRSAADDDQVKPVRLDQFVESVHGTEGLLNLINAQMIGLGDQTALKELEAKRHGREATMALSAIDPNAPVAQQRQQLFGALAGQGRSMGEVASVLGTLMPGEKYLEREVPVDGKNRMFQKQASMDGGHTWQDVGEAAYKDSAYARSSGRFGTDTDLKYERQLVMTEVKDAQKNVYGLRQQINRYKANLGKEITSQTQDPITGEITSTKRIVNNGDITFLEEQLKAEQARLGSLTEEARALGRSRGMSAPTEYAEKARAAATKYNVPFDLVMAVMETESSFDPGADNAEFGPSSGMGLMQLTAPAIKDVKKLGVNVRDPYDPDQNIEGGVAYLKILLDRYGRTPEGIQKTIAAYRAGMGSIDKGVRTPRTRDYVDKVNQSMGSEPEESPPQGAALNFGPHPFIKKPMPSPESQGGDKIVQDGVVFYPTGRTTKSGLPLYQGTKDGKTVYAYPSDGRS